MRTLIHFRFIAVIAIVLFAGACGLSRNSHAGKVFLVYKGRKITTVEQWNKKRKTILAHMQEAMGPLPDLKRNPPFNVHVLDSTTGTGYKRYTIRFTVAKGEDLPALLYLPLEPTARKKIPAVIALHGTDNLGKLSVAGYSALANRDYAKNWRSGVM